VKWGFQPTQRTQRINELTEFANLRKQGTDVIIV